MISFRFTCVLGDFLRELLIRHAQTLTAAEVDRGNRGWIEGCEGWTKGL